MRQARLHSTPRPTSRLGHSSSVADPGNSPRKRFMDISYLRQKKRKQKDKKDRGESLLEGDQARQKQKSLTQTEKDEIAAVLEKERCAFWVVWVSEWVSMYFLIMYYCIGTNRAWLHGGVKPAGSSRKLTHIPSCQVRDDLFIADGVMATLVGGFVPYWLLL